MPLLLIVSLVVIGGLVLLLGSVALLVVCSGINALSDDAPRPGASPAPHPECQRSGSPSTDVSLS